MIFPAAHALTVTSKAFPRLAGQPALVPLRLQGREGVNGLFEYELEGQGQFVPSLPGDDSCLGNPNQIDAIAKARRQLQLCGIAQK